MHGWSIFAYSMVAIVVVVVFALLPKKLPVTENICVYFCSCLVMTSTFTTLVINLKRFELSDRLDFFFCYEFARYFIYPFLLLIFTNVFFTAGNTTVRWGTALAAFTAFCLVHFSYVRLGHFTFRHWNPLFSLIMVASFLAAAWLFEKTFASFFRKEEADSL